MRLLALSSILAAALVIGHERDARACLNGHDWYPIPRQVNVYYQAGTAPNAGLTEAEMRRAIVVAVNAWNEQHGGAVQLRWAGDSPGGVRVVFNAITVHGEAHNPPPFPPAYDGTYCDTNIAHWYGNWDASQHFISGEIQIWGNTTAGHLGSCNPINWELATEKPELDGMADTYDLVSALMHELGHAQGLSHSDGIDELIAPGTCAATPPISIMNRTPINRGRVGKNFDRDNLRTPAMPRSIWTILEWSTKNNGVLISQGRPTFRSSVEAPAYESVYAVDGNTNTRWSSIYNDTQWITVDLGAIYNISRVYLSWETAYGAWYKIQVSNNNSTWTDAQIVFGGDGGVDDLQISATGRYVRMQGIARGTGWGYSLWEFKVYGPESWAAPQTASNLGIGFRPASLSHAYPYTLMSWLDFPVGAWATVARVLQSYYSSSTFNYQQSMTDSAILHPGGVAVSTYSNAAISVYRKQFSSQYTSEAVLVCYRISADGGQTFGAEQCPGSFTTAPRPNVTAAYDPTTRVFLVTYALGNGQIRVVTIPEAGSTTPGTTTDLNDKAWHAPAIACRSPGLVNSCRMVWDNYDMYGCLTWYEARVDSATGAFVPAVKRSQCYEQFDTPSIAYSPVDDTFRLAIGTGSAAYSYKITPGGTSWGGTGDIWNNPNTAISPPTLATEYFCFFSCSGNTRAWFLRYY